MSRRRHPPEGRAQASADFDHFVDDAVEGLLRTAFLVTWDLATAEDLVQDCLFQVARRWPRVRTMEHPRAYARTLLVNAALDDGRRRSRRRAELAAHDQGLVGELPDEAALRMFGRVEQRTELIRALGELAPRQRSVLVLRYLEDLTEAQTATAMGCSVGTVKSTASRALDHLRARMQTSAPTGCDAEDLTLEHERTEAELTVPKAAEQEGSIVR